MGAGIAWWIVSVIRLLGNSLRERPASHANGRPFGTAIRLGERLNNDPSGARYGCFLPDLTELARCLPAPTSRVTR